jgi:hypothetical protein
MVLPVVDCVGLIRPTQPELNENQFVISGNVNLNHFAHLLV